MQDNNNPKYFILDYTHEELENILERVADADLVSLEQVKELINQAQFGGADFTGFAKITYVDEGNEVEVVKHSGEKCERCWNYVDHVEDGICPRCKAVISE